LVATLGRGCLPSLAPSSAANFGVGKEASRLSTSVSVQRGSWIERAGDYILGPSLLIPEEIKEAREAIKDLKTEALYGAEQDKRRHKP
jgi:hypothetical protein